MPNLLISSYRLPNQCCQVIYLTFYSNSFSSMLLCCLIKDLTKLAILYYDPKLG